MPEVTPRTLSAHLFIKSPDSNHIALGKNIYGKTRKHLKREFLYAKGST